MWITLILLQELRKVYREQYDELSRWLKYTPDVQPLKAVRANIKALKSKLRHKLADKVDLEEVYKFGGLS